MKTKKMTVWTRRINRSAKAWLLVGAAFAPVSSPANAQSASAEIDGVATADIVVTAQKRSERLRDVPASVSALTSETLVEKGVTSFNDLGRQTPGLTMVQRGSNIPNVVIRGVGAYGNVQGTGFYVDDVQNFTDQVMRPEDIERIEILKGPQGTLYGGSSLGGAIKYITKQPKFDTSADFTGEVGGHGLWKVYGAINTPIASDVVAARVSAYYSHDGGFITDTNIGGRTAKNLEYSVRGQLLIKPNDNFTATITARTRTLETGTGYVPQNDVHNPIYTSSVNVRNLQRVRVWGVSANLNYDFGPVELTSISSATRQTTYTNTDIDYTNVDFLRGVTDSRPAKVFTQELRLTSANDGAFSWIAGLYAMRGRNITLPASPFDLTIVPINTTFTFYSYDTVQTDLAAFATGNLRLGDLLLSAGARVAHTKFRADSFFSDGVAVNRRYRADNPVVVLPKFTATYKVSDDVSLYASVAEGYEAGKVDVQVDPANPYKSEVSWAYEIGSKGQLFGRALYYEVAAFYIDEKRRQNQSLILTPSGAFLKTITNIGGSTTKGVEAHLEWRPTSDLSFNGAVGYLDATWDSNAVFDGVSIAGRQIPNAARWTGNMGVNFTPSLSDTLELTFNANATYQGRFPWAPDYTPVSGTNPSYWVVTSRIGVRARDGRWEFSVRADNLFDKKYFTEFVPVAFGPQAADGTCAGCHLGFPANRRRFSAALALHL